MSVFSSLNNILDVSMDREYATMLGYTEGELTENFEDHLREHAKAMGLGVDLMEADWSAFFAGLKSLYAAMPYGSTEGRVHESSYARCLAFLLASRGFRFRVEDAQSNCCPTLRDAGKNHRIYVNAVILDLVLTRRRQWRKIAMRRELRPRRRQARARISRAVARARPRCEIAFFSSAESSANERSKPSGTKSGS